MERRFMVRRFSCAWITAAFFASALLSCTVFNETGGGEEIVGSTEVQLDLRESTVRTSEAAIGNLITDAFRKRMPAADVALQNAGGIRAEKADGTMRDFIPPGDLASTLIGEILPFGNKMWLKRITGKQLKSTLERGVSVLGLPGTMGEEGFFLQVSGIKFKVDCEEQAQKLSSDTSAVEAEGGRISEVEVKGEPLAEERTYIVAVCNYIGGGEDGFVELGKAETVGESEETDVEMVMEYLRDASPVSPKVEGRIVKRDNCTSM